MERPMKLLLVGVCICTGVAASSLSAEQQSMPRPAAPQAPYSYVPDLGEVMITTQLRHFKLSYAGRVGNWQLAKYESAQVRKSLEAAATLYPVFQNVQQAKLIGEVSVTALNAIDSAIAAKHRTDFTRSFRTLTNACNSCHEQANIGFVLIRDPTSEHFNNQTFPLNNQVFPPGGRP
jgi:hypothetical protein